MVVLSIHLITFNNEKHIEATLQSILKQNTNFPYEIVVGDDCSTDNTLNIIYQYSANYSSLFKITKNKKRLGILKNFKATLDRCAGLYIFDIAGDDLLKSEDALQKMVNILRLDDTLGFVDSGFDKLYDLNNSIKHFANLSIINTTKSFYRKQILLGHMTTTGMCFNRSHLYKYVDFDFYIKKQITIDDYPILVDLIMNTNYTRISEPLHVYRIHDASYSHKKTLKNHLFLKNQMKELFNYFSIKYTFSEDLIEEYIINYNKELLFLAGYFKDKNLGKQLFKAIKAKSIKDYIHFFASQNEIFRKLISLLKLSC